MEIHSEEFEPKRFLALCLRRMLYYLSPFVSRQKRIIKLRKHFSSIFVEFYLWYYLRMMDRLNTYARRNSCTYLHSEIHCSFGICLFLSRRMCFLKHPTGVDQAKLGLFADTAAILISIVSNSYGMPRG